MTRAVTEREIPRRELYRVEEAVVLLNLSRSQLYELMRTGRIRSVTEGRARLIPASAIMQYVNLLISEADAGADNHLGHQDPLRVTTRRP